MQEIWRKLSPNNIPIKLQCNYTIIISVLIYILALKRECPCSSILWVKFPLLRTQYKMFVHYFFDWKFVIKAPKYTEKDDLFLKLLFYLSSKDLIIKKKRYLFLLLPLSKDKLTKSTSWHLPKDIRAKKKATEFRNREK